MNLISAQAQDAKLRLRRAGVAALNLHIAESVIAEPRMPRLSSTAAQGIRIPLRTAGASLPRKAILVEQFARDQLYHGSALATDRDLRPAGKVLSQVVDRDPRLGICQLDGQVHMRLADRRR